ARDGPAAVPPCARDRARGAARHAPRAGHRESGGCILHPAAGRPVPARAAAMGGGHLPPLDPGRVGGRGPGGPGRPGPPGPARRPSFSRGGERSDFDVTLERPEPPRSGRDSALAVAADVVCLRLAVPGSAETARVRCGRLDNVARRVALTGGDTLVATFAWPA